MRNDDITQPDAHPDQWTAPTYLSEARVRRARKQRPARRIPCVAPSRPRPSTCPARRRPARPRHPKYARLYRKDRDERVLRRIGEMGALRFDQVQRLLGSESYLGRSLAQNPTWDKVWRWEHHGLVEVHELVVALTPSAPSRRLGKYLMPQRRWLTLTSTGAARVGLAPEQSLLGDAATVARCFWAEAARERYAVRFPDLVWVSRALLDQGDVAWETPEGPPALLPALIPPNVDGLLLPPAAWPDALPIGICVRPEVSTDALEREFTALLSCRGSFTGWVYGVPAERLPDGRLGGAAWETAVACRKRLLGHLPNAEQGYLLLRPLWWLLEAKPEPGH